MAKSLKAVGSGTLKPGADVALMWKGLYYVGRGIITNIKKTEGQFVVVVRLLEYHNAFQDMKLPIHSDGLTFIRECVGKHIRWNGDDIRPFGNLPVEVELDSSKSNEIDHIKVKVESPTEDEINDDDNEPVNDDDENVHPNDHSNYLQRGMWRGKDCNLYHKDGSQFGRGRISSCLPDEICDDKVLGDDEVGVLITATNNRGDEDQIMAIVRWPLAQAKLAGSSLTLANIIEFLSAHCISESEDEDEGVKKAPYKAVRRVLKDLKKTSRYEEKTTAASISKVCGMDCCSERCSQHFDVTLTRKIRTRFYLMSFNSRRECGYALQGQLHKRDGMRKRYVTLEGKEVCETAWWQIHGLSRATYMEWKRQARHGYLNSTHGNQGIKRPRLHTIQAEGTIMAIVRQNADLMPNQMKGIGGKRQDVRKVMPAPCNWKAMLEESNRVSLHKP